MSASTPIARVQTTGFVALPPDPRDFKLESADGSLTTASELPASVDLRPHLPPVKDQGAAGSCGAFSASAVIEFHAKSARAIDYAISPQFIYDNRAEDSPGMTMNDIGKLICKLGSPPEAAYPYEERDRRETPCPSMFEVAQRFVGDSFYFIFTATTLKKALHDIGPVIIGVLLHRAFHVDGLAPMWISSGADAGFGGHAMVVVGYDDSETSSDGQKKGAFFIRNSWGPAWNDDGHARMFYDEFEQIKRENPFLPQCMAVLDGSMLQEDPLADGNIPTCSAPTADPDEVPPDTPSDAKPVPLGDVLNAMFRTVSP